MPEKKKTIQNNTELSVFGCFGFPISRKDQGADFIAPEQF